MGIERYNKDDDGFRKYVELLESTPPAKRAKFLEAARSENPAFAEAAEKAVLTFDRIAHLPDMELTEVLADRSLKVESLTLVIAGAEEKVQATLLRCLPRELLGKVQLQMKEMPKPDAFAVGGARLQVIQAARALEASGKLKSVQLPRFGSGYFLTR